MERIARKTIEEYSMCPAGGRLVVGVSGGADSVALLHILWNLRDEMSWDLHAVHVHHGLRGQAADSDRDFVEQLCGKWDIPYHCVHFDVREEARTRGGLGEEETGRILRYEAFREVAQGGAIAVAHHQNDQAETVLMRLCRGTGMTGLQGMLPVNGDVIRPLLFCTRAEIEAYCHANELDYCVDATNDENLYTRNRIRNCILPLLEEINPKAVEHIAKTASLIATDEDYLEQEATALFEKLAEGMEGNQIAFSRPALLSMHLSMRRRVMKQTIAQLGGVKDISTLHLEAVEGLLLAETGKQVTLVSGLIAENVYDKLVFSKNQEESISFCHELVIGQTVMIPECGLEIRLSLEMNAETDTLDEVGHNYDYTKVFDYDKIKQTFFCRNRQAKDKIRLSGGTKKIKDFFVDEKIPRAQRDKIPLIACGEDVLWIIPERVSVAYLPSDETKRFLTIGIRRI